MRKKLLIACGVVVALFFIGAVVFNFVFNKDNPATANEERDNTAINQNINDNENMFVSNTNTNKRLETSTQSTAIDNENIEPEFESEAEPEEIEQEEPNTPVIEDLHAIVVEDSEPERLTDPNEPVPYTANPDGTMRSVVSDSATDLNTATMAEICYVFLNEYINFSDPIRRATELPKYLDVDYIRDNPDSMFSRDYATNYQESMFIHSNMINLSIGAVQIQSYYADDGRCLVELKYTRTYTADNNGGVVQMDASDWYTVFMSNDYKIRDMRAIPIS